MAKKKEKETDKLAQISQQEFGDVYSKIDELRKEVREGFEITEQRFDALAGVLKDIKEDLKEIKANTMTTSLDYIELQARVARLEKKIGISK